jgi:Skp family chaperone for outer membrane proteins
MKRILFIAATLIFSAALALSVSAQTRPGAAAPRPTPPRPTPTPTAQAAAPQTPAPSNAPVPVTKIALVDTSMFGDETNGIIRFVNAVKIVDREFQPRQTELTNLQTRIQAIVNDLDKLRGNAIVDQKSIQDKQNEGERLQREFNDKKAQGDAAYTKRYSEVVGPVSTEIGNALTEYAQQRGVTMTLDFSKLIPLMLTVNPATDITTAFIADFNSKHPAPRTP